MDSEVRVRVSEAMTPHVVTIKPQKTVHEAAKIMAAKNIGGLVVVEGGRAVGIMTERDVCYNVSAADKTPSTMLIKDVMTKRVITISPDAFLNDASKIMARNNIRRLVVMEGEKLAGIITIKDILSIAPEQIEILREYRKMEEGGEVNLSVPEWGTCENCGDYGVELFEANSQFVCESCKEELTGE